MPPVLPPTSLSTPALAAESSRPSALPRAMVVVCGLSWAVVVAGAWVLETRSRPGAPALAMACAGALLGAAALVTGVVAIVRIARSPGKPGIAPVIAGMVLAMLALLAAVVLGFAATLVLSLEVVPIH